MKIRTLMLGLALCATACAITIDGSVYRSDCFQALVGDISLDSNSGSWSFEGACFESTHSACPDLDRVLFEAGVDANGNGTLEDSEKMVAVDEGSPGDQACIAAVSGTYNGPKGDVIVHYEVYVEGQAEPVASKNEVVKNR